MLELESESESNYSQWNRNRNWNRVCRNRPISDFNHATLVIIPRGVLKMAYATLTPSLSITGAQLCTFPVTHSISPHPIECNP